MTRQISWLGFIGTLMIAIGVGIAILKEPARQTAASESLHVAMVSEGADLYAQNCVACHGASGEGIAAYPPLTTTAALDAQTLYNTIERGRYNTSMAAFGVEEGGVLTGAQIQSLVTMIQTSTWDTVATETPARFATSRMVAIQSHSVESLQPRSRQGKMSISLT